MSKCLVLGANGFIASHLVDSLITAGHEVVAFDRMSDRKDQFLPSPRIRVISGDFLNTHDLQQALEGVEYVFHFISLTTPISVDEDPYMDLETNVHASIKMMEACVQNGGIKRILFASTGGSVYGLNSSGATNEDMVPMPVSPYAIGKVTIEHYLRYFKVKYNLDSVVYRMSNPYGERQSPATAQGVIPIFLRRILENEPITIMGDGGMVRDYIYVKDVASMIVKSFERATQPLYNIGSGTGTTVKDLVTVINSIATNGDAKTLSIPVPKTFVKEIVLDTSRYEKEFGAHNLTSLEDGIRQTWDSIKDLHE